MSIQPLPGDISRPLVLQGENNTANVVLVVNSNNAAAPYIRGQPPNDDVIAVWQPNVGLNGAWEHDPTLNTGITVWTQERSDQLIDKIMNVATLNVSTTGIITNDLTLDQQQSYLDNDSFNPYTAAEQTQEEVDPEDNPNQPSTPIDYSTYGGAAEFTDYAGTGDPYTADQRDLRYPLRHTDLYDFIQIFPMKYIPSMQGTGTDALSSTASDHISLVDKRYKGTKAGNTIFLPMIPASETTSTGWGDGDSLNAIQKEFGSAASRTISRAFTSGDFKEWVDQSFGDIKDAGKRLVTTPGLNKFITAYFAGRAVGANLLGRSGVAINPNLELLFSGPGLRSFSYNFRFTPREELEAKEIRDIIKVFKKGMAPRRTEGHMFLNVPNVWSIKYIHNSQNKNTEVHPYLNKIKTCALKTFNVNYMPDNSYMTYRDGGSMTSYDVTMTFGELEPIYNNDIVMSGKDSNNMGY